MEKKEIRQTLQAAFDFKKAAAEHKDDVAIINLGNNGRYLNIISVIHKNTYVVGFAFDIVKKDIVGVQRENGKWVAYGLMPNTTVDELTDRLYEDYKKGFTLRDDYGYIF